MLVFCFLLIKINLKNKNVTENCLVYGEVIANDQTYKKWFANFCVGDFLLKDSLQLAKPVAIDSKDIEYKQFYMT